MVANMSQQNPGFIKVPTSAAGSHTMPVQAEKRLPESAISIELCHEKDAEKIVQLDSSYTLRLPD